MKIEEIYANASRNCDVTITEDKSTSSDREKELIDMAKKKIAIFDAITENIINAIRNGIEVKLDTANGREDITINVCTTNEQPTISVGFGYRLRKMMIRSALIETSEPINDEKLLKLQTEQFNKLDVQSALQVARMCLEDAMGTHINHLEWLESEAI